MSTYDIARAFNNYLDDFDVKDKAVGGVLRDAGFKLREIDELQEFLNNNPGNANTYHNNYHMMTVTLRAHQMFRDSGWDLAQERMLYLATMTHDYAHSGGVTADDRNILAAIGPVMQTFLKWHRPAEGYDLTVALNIIRVTQYPFIHEPQTGFEKIMRDADLLSILEPTWEILINGGLYRELETTRRVNGQCPLGLIPFMRDNVEFLEKAVFYTDLFDRDLFNKRLNDLREELK